MAAIAIQTEDLHKTYSAGGREVKAVRGISLTVREGDSFGLLGPNGAGKSTTFGMLTTRVKPTSGTMSVAGADPVRDPVSVKRRIGAVTQYNTLDRQLTALENLEFRGRFAGLPAVRPGPAAASCSTGSGSATGPTRWCTGSPVARPSG